MKNELHLASYKLPDNNIHGNIQCSSSDCSEDINFINKQGFIISGTIVARFSAINSNGNLITIYYCQGCIDKVYRNLKRILDPNLRIFI